MPMKRVLLLSSLLVATLLPQEVGATLAPMLPESHYHQGFVFYDEEWDDGSGNTTNLRGRIDFAVYDNYGEEFTAAGYDAPGDGQYIYAYQIFNDYDLFWWSSDESVAYFAALGIDMNVVRDDAPSSQEDPESGVEPYDEYFSETGATLEDAVWDFGTTNQDINSGEHSWFLVFSSDNPWVPGDYEIRGPQPSDFPVPEPAMLTLLGIGGAMLFKRRKKFV